MEHPSREGPTRAVKEARGKRSLGRREVSYEGPEQRWERPAVRHWAALVVLTAVGGVLRWRGCLNDFWLDEVWSWMMARRMGSWWEVFTLHHDNNHYLNTLSLYWLGDRPDWAIYRLPSLVAGTLSIPVAWWAAARWGQRVALAAAGLVATSYLLVHYSSEARGYALATFFALLAWRGLDDAVSTGSVGRGVLFAIAASLALLSHLSAVHLLTAALAFSAFELRRRRGSWRSAVPGVVALNLWPWGLLAVLWLVDLRFLEIGGGPRNSPLSVVESALSLLLGGAEVGGLATLGAVLATLLLVTAIGLLVRRRDGSWIFFAVAVVLSPAALLTLARGQLVFVRYFLLSSVFALLLLAVLVGCARHRLAAVPLIAVGLYAAANLTHVGSLLEHGRGSYRAAFASAQRRSLQPVVTVGSDLDFQTEMLLDFYRPSLPTSPPLVTVHYGERPATEGGPEWVLLYVEGPRLQPAAQISDPRGNRYGFVELFPSSGLSGWTWALYHRVGLGMRRGG